MSSDSRLREAERALDLDPENADLLERFVVAIRRSGGFGPGLPGDEDRERVSRRLARLGGDRGAQIEVALRAFSIPWKRVRLVEGRSEWQFKLSSFTLDTGPKSSPDFVSVDCAARVSEAKDESPEGLDLAIHGDEQDCVFAGTSTRRLVDFLAYPRTVPPIIGLNPAAVFRLWRRWEIYRFHYGLSMLLEGSDTHTGHDEPGQHLSPEWLASEAAEEDAGARLASYQNFVLRRRGLDFRCDWRHSACYGEFRFDRDHEPLDPRVVAVAAGSLVSRRNERPNVALARLGSVQCIDTQEDQFWTARDLVEAADMFAGVWQSKDEHESADSFMKAARVLGVTSDGSAYSWFTRDRYDGHRFVCGYTAPDRSRLEFEFVDTSYGKVHAKLWSERPESEPVYAVARTPRELFDRICGIFRAHGNVV